MPELPDLVYIQKQLDSRLPGKSITQIKITEPVVLRVFVSEGFAEGLAHSQFSAIYRHGPFLGFKLKSEFELVLHPMLAGRLKYSGSLERPGRGHCFSLGLSDGHFLHYLDDKKMGKVYLIKAGDYTKIARYEQQGLDILSDGFTLDKFKNLIKRRRNQVRVFLMDQSALSAIGNAYADEILFDARIHPKTFCYQLNQEKIGELYESIRKVIQWGIDEVDKAAQPIENKFREHLKVRNRKDQPCPRCGATIRRSGVLGFDAFFCPQCQPATRRQFIEWS